MEAKTTEKQKRKERKKEEVTHLQVDLKVVDLIESQI